MLSLGDEGFMSKLREILTRSVLWGWLVSGDGLFVRVMGVNDKRQRGFSLSLATRQFIENKTLEESGWGVCHAAERLARQ